jgi:hypothetical protein
MGWRFAFDDLARLDAAGADAHALADAVDLGLHRLQVHVPAAAGGVVGVGDVVSELRAFAAEFTFGCHSNAPILNRKPSGVGMGIHYLNPIFGDPSFKPTRP